MIVEGVIGLALGFGLAQFLRVFALVPLVVVSTLGVLFLEFAGGDGGTYALRAPVGVAIALQSGFMLGVLYKGAAIRKARHSFRASEDPGRQLALAAEEERDKALPALAEKLAAMRDNERKATPRNTKKSDAA